MFQRGVELLESETALVVSRLLRSFRVYVVVLCITSTHVLYTVQRTEKKRDKDEDKPREEEWEWTGSINPLYLGSHRPLWPRTTRSLECNLKHRSVSTQLIPTLILLYNIYIFIYTNSFYLYTLFSSLLLSTQALFQLFIP